MIRRVSVKDLEPGFYIAQTVFDSSGKILVGKGEEVTPAIIEKLKREGISSVLVFEKEEEERARVVRESEEVDIAKMKEKATEIASKLFVEVKEKEVIATREDVRRYVKKALAQNTLKIGVLKLFEETRRWVERFVDSMLFMESLAGLTLMRTEDNFLLFHSVDVAIISALLAKKIYGSNYAAIKTATLGGLLHDIGMALLPKKLHYYRETDALTENEIELLKQHPLLGYIILKKAPFGTLPAHVAYQHHEWQNGTGYPRGLRGTNRLERGRFEKTGFIMEIAEIVAVADTYDLLVCNRPGQSGMGSNDAVKILLSLAGKKLNMEIVEVFLEIVPPYPSGTKIRFVDGPIAGYTAVVKEQNPSNLERPIVSVIKDPNGYILSNPMTVDLSVTNWKFEVVETGHMVI